MSQQAVQADGLKFTAREAYLSLSLSLFLSINHFLVFFFSCFLFRAITVRGRCKGSLLVQIGLVLADNHRMLTLFDLSRTRPLFLTPLVEMVDICCKQDWKRGLTRFLLFNPPAYGESELYFIVDVSERYYFSVMRACYVTYSENSTTQS